MNCIVSKGAKKRANRDERVDPALDLVPRNIVHRLQRRGLFKSAGAYGSHQSVNSNLRKLARLSHTTHIT